MFRSKLLVLAIISISILSACGKSGQLLGDLPPGTIPSTGNGGTPPTGDQGTTPDNNGNPGSGKDTVVENQCKNPDAVIVEGQVSIDAACTTEAPTLIAASKAFFEGDFVKANCFASKIYNESIRVNANKPDNDAAFIAFWSRGFLLFESDEAKQLLLDAPIKSIDIFGPAGKLENLGKALKTVGATPEDPEANAFKTLSSFVKAHEVKGRSMNAIVDIITLIFNRHGKDLHTLLHSMSHDYNLNIMLDFPNNDMDENDIEKNKFNNTIAALMDGYLSLGNLVVNLASYYNVGITNAEVLKDKSKIVDDLNTNPKFLSLRGTADASALNNTFLQATNSLKHTLLMVNSKRFWMKKYMPFDSLIYKNENGSKESYINVLNTLIQLRDSLRDQMVPLIASNDAASINLYAFLKSLPDFNKIDVKLFKYVPISEDNQNDYISFDTDALTNYIILNPTQFPFVNSGENH